ncbi:4-demethylwyosine synthase TYW1 [Candidatus Micrarchaeota archaeon CG_4_10_14_0_2_um_filter_60_11]|nr:MAG: tRNA-modifying enzyme [Candidatus Micrarchaeota archaeon CG1_02_60_51]PIN95810.1 MAG: 4-demethylwyosine synthase TYW1 [Candidatus Micrarchaeota archaeon CG10_big_fil_rev_8_21_14_0_10_60_32]PIO01638.1 MAG: 4-demethylwyosine synthase TYW1 [Candidatus Micrarchaeota archaeon CG09_land_8_20_14_0_10_60_16]PIZ91365.1 MAG: 4-demethylwyosine synthase TYW1 [Candidatus Micrarchaeota archaeon CG_4_10_14_0_2_um_filter_60_11]
MDFYERYLQSLPRLRKAGYAFVGNRKHSAVKVCLWARRALCGKGSCYKQKFYGIKSHRCLQMTPAMPSCNQRCLFCWRDTSLFSEAWPLDGADEPSEIIDGAVAAQRLLLIGFKGNASADRQKWLEAQEPNQAAISLDGEPTMYPKLAELIREFHRRGFTTFLVTNGTRPEALRHLAAEDALPTQLYVSLCAPDEETYEKTNLPVGDDNWTKLNETLMLLPSLATRKVLRLTLVKGLNFHSPERYAKLVKVSGVDYVECKSYMNVGFSTQRLTQAHMPSHDEIRAFAAELAGNAGYEFTDEQVESRVVLLSRDAEAARNRFITRV